MTRLPGAWLLDRLAPLLDKERVESVIVPTLADMQYEAQHAGDNRWRHYLALARGYCALVRLFLCHGFIWRLPMRRAIIVLVLGGLGTALLIAGWQVSAFVAMAALAPLALRAMRTGSSYRQMFVNCLAIGILMVTGFLAWRFFVLPTSTPLDGYARSFLFSAPWIAVGAAAVAAAATRPPAGQQPEHRRRLLYVTASASVYLALQVIPLLALGAVRYVGRPYTILLGPIVGSCVFAAVLGAFYLPLLLRVRTHLHHPQARLLLAAAGAALFPVGLLARAALVGPQFAVVLLRDHPVALVSMSSLKYALAGAVLGWLLAGREAEERPAAA